MRLFGAFEKMEPQDDGTIKVWGIASSESVDGEGEVIKADAMKAALPDYMRFGNIREMHNTIASGVAFEANVGDDGMTRIGAHIVDPVSVKKVKAGVLKGFSIGGAVTARDDSDNKVIKGVKLTEISLVDRPCNPDAIIGLWKADMPKVEDADYDTFAKLTTKFMDAGLELDDVLAKITSRADVSPKEGEDKYGDVKFADEKNKKYPIDTPAHIRAAWNYINKPKNAGKYSSEDLATIKGKIVSAWKAKIDKDGPPSAEKTLDASDLRKLHCEARAALLLDNPNAQDVLKTLSIFAGDKLEKGMWTVSSLACLIGNLFDLQQSVEQEAAYEGDGSILPDELKSAVQDLGEILAHMVNEELEELFPDDKEGDDVDFDSLVVQMAAQVGALKKASDAVLEKAGAKHSADTMEKLQGMHDTLKGMTGGAVCADDEQEKFAKLRKALHAEEKDDVVAKAETLHKALHETQAALAKVTAEREDLKKSMADAEDALTKAAAEIDKLKAEPEPTKTVLRAGLHVVQKGETKDEVEPVRKDGGVDEAATAIKKALATGGRPFGPR